MAAFVVHALNARSARKFSVKLMKIIFSVKESLLINVTMFLIFSIVTIFEWISHFRPYFFVCHRCHIISKDQK